MVRPMTEAVFRHRSGRVIATGRLVLAATFLLAIFIDPNQPNQRPSAAYALLVSYVLLAGGLIWLTWRNWWLDYRLAGPGHLLDIAAFGLVVFFTEGYASPFYTFFVFLLLSAAIRWGWRETALTALLVLLLYIVAGTATLLLQTSEFDLQRLLIRSSYLIVISLVFVWFTLNQPSYFRRTPAVTIASPGEASPIRPALTLAADRLLAARILFAWSSREEPWLTLSAFQQGEVRSERIAPEDQTSFFSPDAGGRPFLFDRARQRALCRSADGTRSLVGFRLSFDADFADRHDIVEGLVIPIDAQDHEGVMIVMGIDGMSADDLETAELVASEVVALFDQASMLAVSEEAATTRARLSLARDLHDSVAQVLAGAAFRLEGLKNVARSGGDIEAEIDSVKGDLSSEQRSIRTYIATLRTGRGSPRTVDFRDGLPHLLDQLGRRWQLSATLSTPDAPVTGAIWLEHELHQIIREAAANAARHGGARSLQVELASVEDEVFLTISDDGHGLPETRNGNMIGEESEVGPWSVNERVQGLGGTASLAAGPIGCRLDIRLPLGGRK